MWVIPKNHEDAGRISWFIQEALQRSRFTATVEVGLKKMSGWANGRVRSGVQLTLIRLLNRKDYCGQHPGPCVVLPFATERKHPHSIKLEGADWVGWNDGLNDIFDKHSIDADIFSHNREAGRLNAKGKWVGVGKFYIRRGLRRRIEYAGFEYATGVRTIMIWAEGDESDFEDYCGKEAPRSTFPDSTPGLACWTLAEEKELSCLVTHAH